MRQAPRYLSPTCATTVHMARLAALPTHDHLSPTGTPLLVNEAFILVGVELLKTAGRPATHRH
jgi:hypothetical protein